MIRMEDTLCHLKKLHLLKQAKKSPWTLEGLPCDHMVKVQGGLFFRFDGRGNRRILGEQPVSGKLKIGFSMACLERERKQIVKKIVSQIGDQDHNIGSEVDYPLTQKEILLVGAETWDGEIQILISRRLLIHPVYKGFMVVYTKPEGEAVAQKDDPAPNMVTQRREFSAKAVSIGLVAG